jgi:carbonic anhydrase
LRIFSIASSTTLVSASAVDRLSRAERRHDADQELVGQGLGNIAVSLFGGIPI